MGLYDEIIVDFAEIIDADLREVEEVTFVCHSCGHPHRNFQTRDLDSAMQTYLLRGSRLLHVLPPKKDDESWVEYTEEQLSNLEQGSFFERMSAVLGGYWKDDAWEIENRATEDMGDKPHQWIKMYARCGKCKAWVEYDLKFTDGVFCGLRPVVAPKND